MTENTSLLPEDKLKLKSWGLPQIILQKYASRGISSMFPWQVECLTIGNVLSGGNLVYSAPTSAGKTMVAEILAIQTILERKKKVIVILPFVSVVREKMLYLQNILAGSGIKVDGFMGSYHPPGGFKLLHLAVCTIEKANSLINRLIEENSMDEIGCVVIDELHLLGDPHRGYLLELLLTKLKYLNERDYVNGVQIVGMSATLPNLNVVANWLNASLYCTDFRPIPLSEYVKVGGQIYSSPDLELSHEIQPAFNIKNDGGDVIYMCIDTVLKGHSAIIFCPTKNWCETLSQQISSEIKRLGFEKTEVGTALRQQLNSQAIADTLEQLKRCPAGLDKVLARSASFGVAFHHAGLTLDERDIVEAAFKQNILRILVATSTLSSGVNLPARRVIIRSPIFYGRCMDILTYKQMIGRAGRMGQDTEGESFLVCNETEKQYGEYLVKSNLPPIVSCLAQGGLTGNLKRALLEVIACGVVNSRKEIEHYTKCTLLYANTDTDTIDAAISACIEYLQSNNFIRLRDDGDISASALAEACLSASIQPDQGLKLLKELYKARKCFILHTDLHAIYQVTPYSICDQWAVDWMRVFSVWEDLPDHMRAVGELVGVEDRFLIKVMRSNINTNSSEHAQKISIHKRFYTALALQDLINEVPLKEVSEKYGCNKGMLQSLQQSASTFAGMVHNFCKRLGWGGLEVIVAELSRRIQFGVHRDLLDLLRLDCMTAHYARSLFDAGMKTLPDLASAELREIESVLRKATPFGNDNIPDDSSPHKHVWISGRSGMTEIEAADIFIHEARRFLLKEMGVKTASWENDSAKSLENGVGQDSVMSHVSDSNYSKYSEKESFLSKELALQGPCVNDSLVEGGTQTESSRRNLKKEINLSVNGCGTGIRSQGDSGASPSDDCEGDRDADSSMSLPHFSISETSVKNTFRLSTDLFENLDDVQDKLESSSIIRDKLEPSSNIQAKLELFSNIQNKLESSSNVQDKLESSSNFRNKLESSSSVQNKKTDEIIGVLSAEDINAAANKNPLLKTFYEVREKPLKEGSHVSRDLGISDLEICADNIVLNLDLKSSTPISSSVSKTNSRVVSKESDDQISCGIKPEDTSETDMFFDSSAFNSSSINNALVCAVENNGQVLEGFDSNWGGDSLLQVSFVLEEIVENNGSILNKGKRKRSCSEEESSNKRTCLSSVGLLFGRYNPAMSGNLTGANNYVNRLENLPGECNSPELFEGSFDLNTQLEGVLDLNSSSPESNGFVNANHKKLRNSDNSIEECHQGEADINVSEHNFLVPSTRIRHDSKRPRINSTEKSFFTDNNAPKITITQKRTNEKFEKMFDKNKSDTKKIGEFTDSFLGRAFECSFGTDLKCADIRSNKSADLTTPYSLTVKLNLCENRDSGEDSENAVDEECIASSQETDYDLTGMSPLKLKTIGLKKKIESPVLRQLGHSDLNESRATSKKAPQPSVEFLKNKQSLYPCNDTKLLKRFEQSLSKRSEIGFGLKIERDSCATSKADRIGAKVMGKKWSKSDGRTSNFRAHGLSLVGVVLAYGTKCYHLDLRNSGCKCIPLIRSLLNRTDFKICGYKIKDQLNVLYKCCDLAVQCKIFDIAVADWILNPEEKEKTLNQLACQYLPKYKTTSAGDDIGSEVLLIWNLYKALKKKLCISNIAEFFEDVEMPTQLCLVYMELSGIGFDRKLANELWTRIEAAMNSLQEEGFEIAGKRFNLSSCKDVSKMKESLKISKENEGSHPLTIVVHNWRKLNSLKTRNLSPLLLNPGVRLHGTCDTRTVTGRISMHDPNIQHVPRDFTVGTKTFSLRSSFVAREGNVLISADFCQLELRILAHFSRDPVLLSLFGSDVDIFVSIAAHWNKITSQEVTEDIRHQTKQLCYGIVYGMGDRALGEAMGLSTIEAAELSAKFHATYSGIGEFVRNCIADCRAKGFITTLKGRVRYLPEINSTNQSHRSQAERQAVNSTIQGSGADIAKSAMMEIEKRLRIEFPGRPHVLSSGLSAHLVLYLHDELVYEVSENKAEEVIGIVRQVMETTTQLCVPLPVKVRKGPSWGLLQVVL